MIITENHPKKDFEQRNIETQAKNFIFKQLCPGV